MLTVPTLDELPLVTVRNGALTASYRNVYTQPVVEEKKVFDVGEYLRKRRRERRAKAQDLRSDRQQAAYVSRPNDGDWVEEAGVYIGIVKGRSYDGDDSEVFVVDNNGKFVRSIRLDLFESHTSHKRVHKRTWHI